MGLKSANQIDIIQSNWGPLFPTTTEISQQTICPILNSTSSTMCFISKLLKSNGVCVQSPKKHSIFCALLSVDFSEIFCHLFLRGINSSKMYSLKNLQEALKFDF